MGCASEPGALIGLGRATRGRAIHTPGAGQAMATIGIVFATPFVNVADITITPIDPTDGETDVLRSILITFKIEDPNVPLEMETLKIQYRQTPFPPQSVDGWVTVYEDGAFLPGFDGSLSEVTTETFSGTGERANVAVQPEFGLLPGSISSMRVEIEDCDGATSTLTWSFTLRDDAVSVSRREDLYRLVKQADRAGWEELLSARSTYEFELDPAITGAKIEVDVNESLVADIGDQLGGSAFDLDILNYLRRYRLLAKLGEYPRDSADEQAEVLFDGFVDGAITFPVFADRKLPEDQVHEEFVDDGRQERVWRYYTLFILAPPTEDTPDWQWIYGDSSTFVDAYPYGRYGHGDVLFDLIPGYWKILDGEQT